MSEREEPEAEIDLDLARRVRALPRAIDPPPQVWEAVAGRIHSRRRRRLWWTGLAAAAVLTAGVAMALRPRTPTPATLRAGLAGLAASERPRPRTGPPSALETAIAELTQAYEGRRSRIDDGLLAVYDRNLGVVDAAIERSQAALADHPDDPHLRRQLDRVYRHKVSLLQRATADGPPRGPR